MITSFIIHYSIRQTRESFGVTVSELSISPSSSRLEGDSFPSPAASRRPRHQLSSGHKAVEGDYRVDGEALFEQSHKAVSALRRATSSICCPSFPAALLQYAHQRPTTRGSVTLAADGSAGLRMRHRRADASHGQSVWPTGRRDHPGS